MNSTGTGFISDTINWFKKPLLFSGTPLDWILWVGVLIIAAWFWHYALHSITGD